MRDFFQGVIGRWPKDEEHYHWHVLPDTNQMREQLCEPFRELPHRDGLVPVPPEWLHVTVQHGGSLRTGAVTALSEPEMGRIADRVEEACAEISPFEATVDRPRVGNVAVERGIRYGRQTSRLWHATMEATREVIGDRVPVIPKIHWPHMSIAYAVDELDAGPLRQWMSDCDWEPVTFPVSRLTLVAQSHNCREITWRPLLDIPLGQQAA